jgi:NADH-quinone oxidoreductase subunit C
VTPDKTPATTPPDREPSPAAGVPEPAAPAGRGAEVVGERTGLFGIHGSGDTTGFGGLVRTVVVAQSATRPFGGYFDDVVDLLAEVLDEQGLPFAEAVERITVDRGELTLFVSRAHLLAVARALRDEQDLRFELSLGVSGVHYPHDVGRELHAVYHLVSITHGRSLRLEVVAPDADPHIPSTVSVYPTHDWHERETWDFFGIVFDGHPSLARIAMPDDWPGHPQRKDYPLGGIPVEYKGATVPPADDRRSYS